jgi:hypothetical protein
MRPNFSDLHTKHKIQLTGSKLILLITLTLLVTVSGCRRDEDKDLLPPFAKSPQPSTTLESDTEIKFISGWHDLETDVNGQSWRWMGKRGELHVRNQNLNMKLQIRGWAPVELLKTASTIQITLNGRLLETFTAPAGHFTKEYLVQREMQGAEEFSTLILEASNTITPENDTRELGYALTTVAWKPAKP